MMNERFDKGALIRELEGAGAIVRGAAIKCPFHDDKSPSGGVYCDEAGIWRYKCHASECAFGGDVFDIRAKIQNRPVGSILKETSSNNKPTQARQANQPKVFLTLESIAAICPGKVDRWHKYTNPDSGKPDMIVLRYMLEGKKQFWQITPNHRGYYLKAPAGLHPLYNRIRLQAADRIIVTEGEVCVERLHRAGFVATTSPGGSGAAHKADWGPLCKKRVYLWPDLDDAGNKYMKDVADVQRQL